MNIVFLSLGSNLGNRQNYLKLAQNAIVNLIGEIQTYSSVYETEPWGFKSEVKFLNQVVIVRTNLKPEEILDKINIIEKELGRIRGSIRYSAREIDIDILFYNQQIYESANLVVPHSEIQNRRFILEPLAEIAGHLIHPVIGISISALLAQCKDKGEVLRVADI